MRNGGDSVIIIFAIAAGILALGVALAVPEKTRSIGLFFVTLGAVLLVGMAWVAIDNAAHHTPQ